MKRALAERAKQSAGQLPPSNGGGPFRVVEAPTTSRSTDDAADGRPVKIPRRAHDNDTPTNVLSIDGPGGVSGPLVPTSGSENMTERPLPSMTDPNSHLNAGGPPPSSSSSNINMKRPRNDSSGAGTTGNSSTSSSSQPKPPQQAPQHYASDDVTEESQSNMSSFYLKHQNQALASELKALRYQLSLLERERDYRRKQCQIACQALNSLQATWSQMESGLQQANPQNNNNNTDDRGNITNKTVAGNLSQDAAPMSTGTGPGVEFIGALLDSLATLSESGPPPQPRNNTSNTDMKNQDSKSRVDDAAALRGLDPTEKHKLEGIGNVSRNILQRANTLEQWIWSILQRLAAAQQGGSSKGDVDVGGEKEEDGDDRQSTTAATLEHRQLIKEVGELRGQCREYQAQISELAKARDELAKSERKVRRSIYRLSTGRVNIEQVLKDMEKSDEDGTLAAEAKMEALVQQESLAGAQPDAAVSTTQQESPGAVGSNANVDVKAEPVDAVSNAEVTKIRNQLTDLEQKLVNRDKSIEEVGFLWCWIILCDPLFW